MAMGHGEKKSDLFVYVELKGLKIPMSFLCETHSVLFALCLTTLETCPAHLEPLSPLLVLSE